MKTLTSSCSNMIINKFGDRGYSCLKELSLNRPELGFSPSKMMVNPRFLHLLSLQHKASHPVCSSSSLSPDSQVPLETLEPQVQKEYRSNTVHVKFQLQKECSFGEHFFLVGDNPMLGIWDPESAIPMTWSDGHFWNVELDIHISKSINFKFILKGKNGNILWQPGPDRVLKIWETKNTITVCEDWEDAQCRKILEETPLANQDDDTVLNSGMAIVAENLSPPMKEIMSDESQCSDNVDNPTYPVKVLQGTPREIIADDTGPSLEKPMPIIADNISYPDVDFKENGKIKAAGDRKTSYPKTEATPNLSKTLIEAEEILGNNGRAVTSKHPALSDVKGNLVIHDEGPVLVPGLIPSSTLSTEDSIQNEDDKNIGTNASVGVNEAIVYSLPELDEKQEADGDPHQEETEMYDEEEEEQREYTFNEKPQLAREEQPASETLQSEVLKSDIQWGRRTLQKFLTNLGFL